MTHAREMLDAHPKEMDMESTAGRVPRHAGDV